MQKRINFTLLKRFWSIARLYWFGEEKWKARGLLAIITLMLVTYTVLSVILNQQRGSLITALSQMSEDEFWRGLLIYFGVILAYIPLFAGANYLIDLLGLFWRRWLTGRFLDNYFLDRAYYKLTSNGDIDNPDQRISQDVRSFTQDSLTFLLVTISSLFQVIGFSSQLWTISFPLVIFLFIYAIAGTLITVGVFGRALVRLNFEQLKREANFRFGLVRIRENAESIAFYQGENQEESQVKFRFDDVFDNFRRLILWQDLGLKSFTNSYLCCSLFDFSPKSFFRRVRSGKSNGSTRCFFTDFLFLKLSS